MSDSGTCRSCGAHALEDFGPCAPYPPSAGPAGCTPPGPPGRLARCNACGLGQRQPCLPPDALAALYSDGEVDAMDYEYEKNMAWSAARDRLASHASAQAHPRILDIGCHTGAFLAGLPTRWQRAGVESAASPRAVAQSQGIELVGERVESLPEACLGRFDAVTLFDVFEHLLDPAAGLRAAAACLRPGGLLLVSTADMDAWTWRVAAGRHWYLQTPQHLSFASRDYFERFAGKHGLVLREYHPIAHGKAAMRKRLRDSLEFAHWEFRHRGGAYRVPQRLLQALPGFRSLAHRTDVPWAMTLRDHALAVLQLPEKETRH